MKFIVIGISDSPNPFFPPEVMSVIQHGRVFSGGKRHHEIVAPLLPPEAVWVDIIVPLDSVFEQYQQVPVDQQIVVFASGDPLFFGFANTIMRKLPEAEVKVFPTFNSLQMLAHKMLLPYHDMQVVSLTGRDWAKFDEALINGKEMIGCLTDRVKTPYTIQQRMSDFGYTNYLMTVGENMGNEAKERVSKYEEQATYDHPNCIILQKMHERVRPFGIPDNEFALLDGREKMITKMPIRLLVLQSLELRRRSVLWDIGACTGSVSIEARLQFPHLRVEAFEVRPECEEIINTNMRRHGASGIHIHIGDFLENDEWGLETAERPDAVFIGGHGGRLKEILAKVNRLIAPGGVIVMNSVVAPRVQTDSRQLWDEACCELNLQQDEPTHIQLNNHHPITILKCRKLPSFK